MKIQWTKEHTANLITGSILAVGGILIYFTLRNFNKIVDFFNWVFGILAPFIYGFIFAYLMNPTMKFVERVLAKPLEKKKPRPKLKRMLAVAATLLFVLLLVIALFSIVLPQLGNSIYGLVKSTPSYLRSFESMAREFLGQFNLDESFYDSFFISTDVLVSKFTSLADTLLPYLIDFSKELTSSVTNIFVGIVVSIYLLAGKERFFTQIKKMLAAFLSEGKYNALLSLLRSSNKTFGSFISSKLVDSLIVGILCYIGMTIFRMDYALLISVVVGVTNIIPFFGPLIGAIPGVLILLIISPIKALGFLVFIILLQQFDGNILGPKIVGGTIGLSPFWVMFAIIVGGGLFGFIGMFVGVPAFAVIYSIVCQALDKRLEQKGLSVDVSSYRSQKQAP